MIKNSIGSFLRNLIIIFIPMGIIYLFLLFGIFYFLSEVEDSLSQMLSSLGELFRLSAEQSSVTVKEFLIYTIEQLDLDGDPEAAIQQIFSREWFTETVKGFFAALSSSTEGFDEQFENIITKFTDSLTVTIAVTASIFSLGIVLANYATGFAIRKRTIKRGIKKFILAHTLVPFFQGLVLTAGAFLIYILHLAGILLFAALAVLMSLLSFLGAFLIHRDKDTDLKDFLTLKLVLSQLAVCALILLADFAIGVPLFCIDPLLATLIMLPLLIYSMNVMSNLAEEYVYKHISEKKPAKEAF